MFIEHFQERQRFNVILITLLIRILFFQNYTYMQD
jgi:hypothetical protein